VRPSIDPVLMIRMLAVGYVFAIRSERALCRDVQVNLAYRWFCINRRQGSGPFRVLACTQSRRVLEGKRTILGHQNPTLN
jgi:hypothetical protein